jgi:SNF2 family DNA or RNA helicase
VPYTTNREWTELHTEKLDALEDLIDELQGNPLLVAYDFMHELERIQARFGKDVPYIGSGVSLKRSKELETLWNAGKLPYLFGHPQSIALGLNLQQASNHVCWFSMTWSWELYDQLVRRVYRQGNKASTVFVHRLLAKDTIDETMVKVLKTKKTGQDDLFNALKQLHKKN